jgi:hypothetical protein
LPRPFKGNWWAKCNLLTLWNFKTQREFARWLKTTSLLRINQLE